MLLCKVLLKSFDLGLKDNFKGKLKPSVLGTSAGCKTITGYEQRVRVEFRKCVEQSRPINTCANKIARPQEYTGTQ